MFREETAIAGIVQMFPIRYSEYIECAAGTEAMPDVIFDD